MSSDVISILCGLASAVSWGAGDFSGGVATRRTPVSTVMVLSQLVGLALLSALAVLFAEQVPAAEQWLLGGAAGVFGGLGLMALYSGLARGRMGVVAPVAAVVAAVLPVAVGMLTEGLPLPRQLAGFALALVAVWILTLGDGRAVVAWKELALPLAAGGAFALFFILIDRVSTVAVLWPLVAARIASVVLISALALLRGRPARPGRVPLLAIALAGIFDSGGNAFFAVATRLGRLDTATVLSSLYPASTVVLAWLMLRERLAPRQWAGVLAALIALMLIAL